MAFNRFVKPGRSQYVSQYVPMKMPFQVWDKKLQQADAKIEQDMLKFKSLGADLGIEGADRFNMGRYGKRYYGTTDYKDSGDIILGDRQKSMNSYNAIMSDINSLSQEEMIKKIGTGEFADNIIKTQQKVQEHKAKNARYKAREESLKEINKNLVANKDEWERSPHLRAAQDEELRKAAEDETGTYIPQLVGVGKYFDRSKYILDNVGKLKDESSKSYDLSDPDFIKWSKNMGVTADRYAAFTRDLLSDQNSALYADVEREIAAMWTAGKITSDEEEQAARRSIQQDLVETAENLEHMSYDQGMTESSEARRKREIDKQFEGVANVDLQNIDKEQTTYSDLETNLESLNLREAKINQDLQTSNISISKRNQLEKELQSIEQQKNELRYNLWKLEQGFKTSTDYYERTDAIKQSQAELLILQNPEIYKQLFTEQPVSDGTVQYSYNEDADLNSINNQLATKYAKEYGVSVEEAMQKISETNLAKFAMNQARGLNSNQISKRINQGKLLTSIQSLEAGGDEFEVNISSEGQGLAVINKKDSNGNITSERDFERMKSFLDANNVEYNAEDVGDITSKFSTTYKTGKETYKNLESKLQKQETELSTSIENYRNAPLAQIGEVDITARPAVIVSEIPEAALKLVYNNMDPSKTQLSVDGKIIQDLSVVGLVADDVMSQKDKGGIITSDGGFIIKGVTERLLQSEEGLKALYAELKEKKADDNDADYNKWKADLESGKLDESFSITIVPNDSNIADNIVDYGFEKILQSNKDNLTKSIEASQFENSSTLTDITSKNQNLVVTYRPGQTVPEKVSTAKSSIGTTGDSLPMESTLEEFNKDINLRYVSDEGSPAFYPIKLKTTRVVGISSIDNEPQIAYTYKDKYTNKEETILVSGTNAQNFVEEFWRERFANLEQNQE